MKKQILPILFPCVVLVNDAKSQNFADFESFTLPESGYLNGSEGATEYKQADLAFEVKYNFTFNFWSGGFAISNKKDNQTAGYNNLYSACTGGGVLQSNNYAIGQNNAKIKLVNRSTLSGLYVTNTTYALKSMENGDMFAKKFGGDSGNDPDWFLLTIKGYINGVLKTDSVNFYLADYRFSEPELDYLVRTWRWVDLTALGEVDSLVFLLSSSDVGIYGMNTPAFFAIDNVNQPYFAPKAGQFGSTAMHKDDPLFKNWATSATVFRGPRNIAQVGGEFASHGVESNAIGKADGQVISLGDGGSIILEFSTPIRNGLGFDFAVFENGFSFNDQEFLELAFVEVSSDGQRYVRFPAISNTDVSTQVGSFGYLDAKFIHNLAGKYIANYGTPFDLEDLKDSSGIDLENIRFVKIIDVVGSIHANYARYDRNNNPINDPWPTDFASSGFDLDAVGVINEGTNYVHDNLAASPEIYPNPFQDAVILKKKSKVSVTDVWGNIVFESEEEVDKLNTSHWKSGIYFIRTDYKLYKINKL